MVLLCPFNWKLRPSEVSLVSPGIENIRQLPRNRAEVGQNYDPRYAHRDFDKIRLDFSELGRYYPVPRSLN